jgi:hypothetical protein
MHVTPAQFQDALATADFPADKEAILRSAQETGADEAVLQSLRSLPPAVAYANKDEVVRSVRHPAAESGPSPSERHEPHRDDDRSGLAERLR